MQTDFNQQGQTYNCLAFGQSAIDYGMLRKSARNYLVLLNDKATRSLAEADPGNEKSLLSIHACLLRFQSFLLQSSRMANHSHQTMNAVPLPEAMIVAAIDDACIDFESLLSHGRAALDRLTFYLCSQFYKRMFEKWV